MSAPKPTRPTIRQAVEELAAILDDGLRSRPWLDRPQNRTNAPEALLQIAGCLKRIAEALERRAPPPADPNRLWIETAA